MDIQALFMEKWPYKVAAIVLSVLLWLNVTADQPTQDQRISTRVEYEVRDSSWAIGEAPREVSTIFQGRSGDIIALFNAPVLRAVIDAVDDSVVEVTFDVGDVVYDRSLNVVATAVSPPRVLVHLEPRRVKSVPVVPLSDAQAAPGFAIDRTVVRPDSVRLSGPASAVDPVDGVATERLAIGELRDGVSRLATLLRPEGPPSLEMTPTQVSVTIEVDTMIVRRFQVAVAVVGAAAEGVAPDPEVVRVEVSGAAGTVQALSPMDLTATVRVDGPISARQMLPIDIRLPADVNARAVAEPALVTVAPISSSGRPPAAAGSSPPASGDESDRRGLR